MTTKTELPQMRLRDLRAALEQIGAGHDDKIVCLLTRPTTTQVRACSQFIRVQGDRILIEEA